MNEEGFTLIEVLVAITIAGIILAAVFSFLDLGLSTWQRSNSYNDYEQQWRVLGSFIRRDLHKLFVPNMEYKDNFKGEYQNLQFIILDGSKLKEVNYFFDHYNDQLIRELKLYKKDKEEVKDEEVKRTKFFTNFNLDEVIFTFYDPEYNYWQSNWLNKEVIPSAIKMEVVKNDLELPPLVINIYVEREY